MKQKNRRYWRFFYSAHLPQLPRHSTTRHTATQLVIPRKRGIQLMLCINLCHLALLHRFAVANWIPAYAGMTIVKNNCNSDKKL